jgi:hypothetical protein
MCIYLRVPLKVDRNVTYTLGYYYEQPPVDVKLTGLMCEPKFGYVMYMRVEPEECQ